MCSINILADEGDFVVACIGDSITFGTGSEDPETQSYPAQLQLLLGDGYDVRNFGKAGCSLTSGGVTYTKRQEYQDALDSKADAYIVMLGTNDSYTDIWNAEEYEACLNTMIEELRTANPDTLIMLMVPPHVFIDKEEHPHSQENSIIGEEIMPIMEKVSMEQETGLIDLYSFTEDREDLYCGDLLHPGKEGYVEIAHYVYDAIQGILVPAGESAAAEINVACSMSSFGKEAKTITISIEDGASLINLTPEDFTLSGCITDASSKRARQVAVNLVSFTSDSVILEVDPFVIGSSTDLFMDCTNDLLDFTYEDITAVTCPEQDVFTDETMTIGGTTLRYKLYAPSTFKDDELVPVVIYNHGGGCTGYEGVLEDDSFACFWALPESQNSIKCYVMAPYRGSLKEGDDPDEEREAIKAAIDALITDGHADPDRIYMTGESMGSIYTVTFANAYPDYLAAIAVMNGGPLDIEKGTSLEDAVQMDLASPWSDAELQALADSQTAVMFIQGTGDIASIPIRYATVYTKLVNMGMTPDVDVVWNPYTAEQFNALLKGNTKIPVYATAEIAVDPITGIETLTNGNFHNSSRVAGFDIRVRTWLMIQELNKEPLGTTEEE